MPEPSQPDDSGQPPSEQDRSIQERLEQQRLKANALEARDTALKGTSLEREHGPVRLHEESRLPMWLLAIFGGLLVVICGGFGLIVNGFGRPAKPTTPVQLTLYYDLATASQQETALYQLIDQYQAAHPDVTINVLNIPFGQGYIKWETEMAAGAGPDLFLTDDSRLETEAGSGMLMPLDQATQDGLKDLLPSALQVLTYNDRLYGVPLFLQTDGLYYNTSTIQSPPRTTDELLALVRSGKKLVLLDDSQRLFGFLTAFGASFDPNTGACSSGAEPLAKAAQYLLDLRSAGAEFAANYDIATSQFALGKIDLFINGSWALANYEDNLGAGFGVASLPAGPFPARSLVDVEGFYINANAHSKLAALDFALFAASQPAQATFSQTAGVPPVSVAAPIQDPNLKAFIEIARQGAIRPPHNSFNVVLDNLNSLLTSLLQSSQSPAIAAERACTTIQKANP